jgi:catechol 2,3-dioxygenase-like lactoylglutathione lyase family enzyme
MWKTRTTYLTAVFSTCFVLAVFQPLTAADREFVRTTIDLGVVVSDVDKAVDFYAKAIGFQEIKGFSVDGDLARDAGLTDSQPLNIRVLVLGKDDTATKLKLMEVPGVQTKPGDSQFIHSQFGFSYITIYVCDTNAALTRLKKAGVKPLAKGPVALPPSLAEGVFLTVVRDPDGNVVELVGPKK